MQRHTVTITTDADGNGTGYTAVAVGTIRAIRYVKTDYADTADFTITANVSGLAILAVTDITATTTWYPRAATCTTAAAASLYAGSGTAVNDGIPIADEPVKIVVAQGGATKSGTFYVYVGT